MEYDKYKRKFAVLMEDFGFVEGHFDFSVDPNMPNQSYPQVLADETQDRIERYQSPDVASPGIKFKRRGLIFHVDMVAARIESHLDYLDRAYTEIGLSSGTGLVPLQNTTFGRKLIDKK